MKQWIAAGILMALVACGGGSGSPAPTAPTQPSAVVAATMSRSTGQRVDSGGYRYEVVIDVRETGGLG
jgi:hypothetical protein